MQLFNLDALIKTPTYYQLHNWTCIDNILRNQKSFFKLSKTFGNLITVFDNYTYSNIQKYRKQNSKKFRTIL